MGISKTNTLAIKKVFLVTMILIFTMSFSINNVSAKESDNNSSSNTGEILTGKEANKYIKAVEKNNSFKKLTSSEKLVKKNAKVEKFNLESDQDFKNNIIVLQSKIDNKKSNTGILAIIDAKTYNVMSITTVNENDDLNGLVFTEYDGESGEILLQNNLVNNEVVKDKDTNDNIQPAKIDKGSYWWKVICNLSTGGSCALGCLALIAVPGGYPACTLLCSAFAGGAAC